MISMTTRTIERRFTSNPVSIVRPAGKTGRTGRTVRGYASIFNRRSENLGTAENPWFEVIAPGAFDGVLKDDVRCLVDHDSSRILARSRNGAGTLRIGVDRTGLWYEFEAPDTSVGNDILVSLERGDVDQSSFGFIVAPKGDSRKKLPDGSTLRTIHKIGQLLDVSLVAFPAYADAAVGIARARTVPVPADNAPLRSYWRARFGIS